MSPLFFIRKTVHRHLLENELRKRTIGIKGKILDIGSKDARYAGWFSGEIVSIDTVADPTKKVQKGDIYNLNFPNQSFDAVLSTEVFQYLENPHKALAEIHRVLIKGGTLLLSAPFIYRAHYDLVRYTEDYWKRLLKNFKKVEVIGIGNPYTAVLDMLQYKIVRLPSRLLRYFFYLLFFVASLFIPISLKFFRDKSFVSGFLIVVRK